MKYRSCAYSLVGTAVLLAALLNIRNDRAYAAEVEYAGKYDAWGWSGMPANQGATDTGSTDANYSPIGFISFNCHSNNACNSTNGNHPLVDVDTNTGAVTGWAWIGTTATTGDASIGWLNFAPAPLPDSSLYADNSCSAGSRYPAPPCHPARIEKIGTKMHVTGWARLETLAAYGDTILGTTQKNNDWGWVLLGGITSAATPQEFGLLYRNGTFEGWMWSGGGSLPDGSFSNAVGLGWVHFIPSESAPYISTSEGDVYSAGGITNPTNPAAVTSQSNATFLLLGDTTGDEAEFVHFTTTLQNGTLGNYGALNLPSMGTGYRSELGRLELEKLTTQVIGSENVYGDTVTTLSNDLTELTNNTFLNGGVYVVGDGSSTYTLSHEVLFKNEVSLRTTGEHFDGSGIIVVKGNLNIDANILYESFDPNTLVDSKNIASVAWIVLGDVTMKKNVDHVVGAFYVLGNEHGSTGVFTTEAAYKKQFVLYGLVMAREFLLQRTYLGSDSIYEPAELFYYDSRVLLNTPPGLRDFTSTLPTIEQK